MKGMILAGGRGTRLAPLTLGVGKQLLPVYDKPMIYYPLSTLMLAGIREVLVVSAQAGVEGLRSVLGRGNQWGLAISYQVQSAPRGVADAFLAGSAFAGGGPACVILGDNIFFGRGLPGQLSAAVEAVEREGGAAVFAGRVTEPRRYGVIEIDADGRPLSITEKPDAPKSDLAVAGIYCLDGQAAGLASLLEPSTRGELEIADLLDAYMRLGALRVERLGSGTTWLDAGTPETLLQASNFVREVQEREGRLVSSPEEIAFRLGYIDAGELRRQAAALSGRYGESLARLAEG